jgi:PTH1 family peptidyl-tRNA hydrolase
MQYLLVGLGNPGNKYVNTRHNIGFLAVDYFASRIQASNFEHKFDSLFAQASYNDKKLFLLKPQTFMNLSGEAVSKIVRFYKIPLENIIVLHDDVDIPFEKIKVKQGGGSAGHNGIKSIDHNVGNNYHRIRIGVGKPEDSRFDISDFVLSDFSQSEQKELQFIFEEVKDELLKIFRFLV